MSASKLFITIVVAALPSAASGDDNAVALLARIEGNVLVVEGSSMASATQPVRLVPGMRVLPTFSSSAEVVFDDGCHVRVDPGERYVVEKKSPCRRAGTVESDRPSQTAEAPR